MAVTIQSMEFWADWPNSRDTTFELRATAQKDFVSAEGEFVPAGIYRTWPGSIVSGRPILPEIELPATSAGIDTQSATWTVSLHRNNNNNVVHNVASSFSLPVVFEPLATWGEIRLFKNGNNNHVWRDTGGFSRTDALNMINSRISTLVALSTDTRLPPATGSRVLVANQFPGADLGAKINAADLALGSDKGIIIWYGGGAYTTRINLSANHTLYLTAGTYTYTGIDCAILMDSYTTLYGDGNQTILVENSNALTDGRELQVICQKYTYNDNGATAQNIIIHDLQILGTNAAAASTYPTLNLGNTHHARVWNVFFNGTRTIGVSCGAHPSSGADPLSLGRYAEDVIIEKCSFYMVASQNAAIVNGKNIIIQSNIFDKPSRAGLGLNSVVIDCEVNAVGDKMENIQILNNILDSRASEVVPHGNFINYQPGATFSGPARISGNMVYADQITSNGVVLGGNSADVEISNNYIQGMGQNGLNLRGVRLNVFGNTLKDTGQVGGNASISMEGVTYSKIHSNVLWSPTYLNDLIVETTQCDYNQIFNNYCKNAPTLTGANSRAWNNFDRQLGVVNTDVSVATAFAGTVSTGAATLASATVTGKITSYNGSTTEGNGVAAIIKSVNLTGQTAAIAKTALFTAPATGMYAIDSYFHTTTVGGAGTMALVIYWTDDTNVERSLTFTTIDLTSTTNANSFQAPTRSIKVKTGTVVSYEAVLTGVAGNPQYSLSIIGKRQS